MFIWNVGKELYYNLCIDSIRPKQEMYFLEMFVEDRVMQINIA